MRTLAYTTIFASCALLAEISLQAQMFGNMAPTFAMNNQIFSNMANQAQRNANGYNPRQTETRASARVQPVLTYAPSIARRRVNSAAFVKRLAKIDPSGAAQLSDLLSANDMISQMGTVLAPYGLRTDNVADVYATWWTQSWQAAHGDTSDPSRATMQAVKRQTQNALASAPVMSTMNDAAKQEMAETMLLQAGLTASFVDTYKNDPAMMRKLGTAVRKGAMAVGLDLDSMTLTEKGFVPSGRTGATGPAPGASEQALAAKVAPAPEAANDKSPPYVLLAAAGGAGLGGVYLLGKMMGKFG
jgi:hypothetical protein